MPVLLQYYDTEHPEQGIVLHDLWMHPIQETMDLFQYLCENEVCAFNLVFDWFHINKFYNVIRKWNNKEDHPVDIIPALAVLDRPDKTDLCLKPKAALDLMLVAKKGPYQNLMDRSDIRIKRVPTAIAYDLAIELEKRVPLKDIFFARKSHIVKWQVEEVEDLPEFKNVVLRFAPKGGLKTLIADIYPGEATTAFQEIAVDKRALPEEKGYRPYGGTWPDVIHIHIDHWRYNKLARQYASNDVKYLQMLHKHFDMVPAGDDDSELAAMVAAIRWKGFVVDLEKIKDLRVKALVKSTKAPTAPNRVKDWIWPLLTDTQQSVIDSTKRTVLEEIAKWEDSEAAIRAQAVLDARHAQKEVELYDKLLTAKQLHASAKIIGTLSGRMSGADGLNVQGIKNTIEVRSSFPLAPEGMVLSGGDFDAFEVTIAVAYYDDQYLYADLKKGKKIHALFGEELYPEEDYDSILASKGTEDDKYTKSKSALFAMGLYGGTGYTVKTRLGIDEKREDEAKERWMRRYPGIGKKQKEIHDLFCSMRQPGGLGTRVEWHVPADYIESMLGFPRYFTLENSICKALFDIGENPPEKWKRYRFKVHRRDRDQSATGAARSACFGAAFAIQGANLRAATNHVIQSTGAEITKHVQRRICDLQPSGIHSWIVLPLNIHDEIMCPVIPEMIDELEQVVQETVKEYRDKIPLLQIDWKKNLRNWADK